MVAALLRHGPQRLAGLEQELRHWLGEHGYVTARELVGCMAQERCPDPEAYERVQYLRVLGSLALPAWGEGLLQPWSGAGGGTP